MTTVVERIIGDGGPQLSEGPNGYEITEHFMVSDLDTPESPIAGYLKMQIAINAHGVPKRGDKHPDVNILGANLRVHSREAALAGADNDSVVVTIKYQNFEAGDDIGFTTVSVGSTLQETEASTGIVQQPGQTIPIYEHPIDLLVKKMTKVGDVDKPVESRQFHTVQKQIPMIVFTLTRREQFFPVEFIKLFHGKVNKDAFLGQPPGTLLISRIDANTDDGGNTYMVTYEMQRAPVVYTQETRTGTSEIGWDVEVCATNQSNDKVEILAPDVYPLIPLPFQYAKQFEQGAKQAICRIVQLYERVQFTGLGFSPLPVLTNGAQ